jgi:hypothetical protein
VNNMPIARQLAELIERRQALFSDDEKIQEANDKQIDELAKQIYDLIRQHHSRLSVEAVIEGLTKLGAAPSILYDDNGHFYIGGDGHQNLPTVGDDHLTKETTFEGCWYVEAGGWKKTIREALNSYLDKRCEDQ